MEKKKTISRKKFLSCLGCSILGMFVPKTFAMSPVHRDDFPPPPPPSAPLPNYRRTYYAPPPPPPERYYTPPPPGYYRAKPYRSVSRNMGHPKPNRHSDKKGAHPRDRQSGGGNKKPTKPSNNRPPENNRNSSKKKR